jgi:hypothetical protein
MMRRASVTSEEWLGGRSGTAASAADSSSKGTVMAKPIDKTDAKLQEHFQEFGEWFGMDSDRYLREQRRQYKKDRTKHLRRQGKEELRRELDAFEEETELFGE